MSELFSPQDLPKDLPQSTPQNKPYLVLARAYRPQNFADLIGQQALVQTLQNAIITNRIHHAYVLTGIRGVGKTTTARLLAMALNCEGGPATTWPADDAQCTAIAQGRHVDVLEFDAASHTGVDDVRQLFEGVGYQPVQGRYKIYIIDEVHMLSRQAFNALLKTLEEPPAHVKFIFATTEVHKIPVTVLSRCQRFDLKRITAQELTEHFTAVCAKEGVRITPGAVALIAQAADGSARDGLSLLDQAIALSSGVEITETAIADMLGQASMAKILQLLECVLSGQSATVLQEMQALYHNGHDPLLVAQDMLKALHLLTRLKIIPTLAQSPQLSEAERLAAPLAERFPLDGLGRAYQMLLQGLEEAKKAPRPLETVEMALVRITYLAPLPALDVVLSQLQNNPQQGEERAQKPAPTQAPVGPAVQMAPPAAAPQAELAPWDDSPPPQSPPPPPKG